MRKANHDLQTFKNKLSYSCQHGPWLSIFGREGLLPILKSRWQKLKEKILVKNKQL